MPQYPGEGMTGTDRLGLPQLIYITLETLTHNRIHTSFLGRNQSAPGRTTVKTVRPRYAAGASS